MTAGLPRAGLIAGLGITKGGHLRLNVWNGTESAIHLNPKTVMVNVFAESISVKCLRKDIKLVSHVGVCEQKFADRRKDEIVTQYSGVGDFSTHPMNDEMAKLIVKASEISWIEPPERGSRTQYIVETVADRQLVDAQLRDYVRREYLKDVSVSEDVCLSPLLPIRKPNGTYRFTNDFWKLNSYFPSKGITTQVDVWRKMWELKP